MVLTLKATTSPLCSKTIFFSSSKCLRSRCMVVSFPCFLKTDFGHGRRLYPYRLLSSSRGKSWSLRSQVDNSRSDPPGNSANGRTRLVRAIQDFRIRLIRRIKELRKGLPMKVLFFLVGFYCATAFATVIGQTGDWDILSAGLAVVVVEGIGALMYRASLPMVDRIKGLITMFNYWKAGLSLGLFLDAFKYEIDAILGFCRPFDFEMDMFPIFW